jgi:hypothetical protein
MGWFGKLLGTDKALDTASDLAKSGMDMLDNAFYTDQERAETKGRIMDTWLSTQKLIAEQSTPTAISRRIIAWGVLSLVWLAVAVGMAVILMDGNIDKINGIIGLLDSMQIGWAFVSIIVFYFGPHIMSAIGKKS